jgi:hypothetical protein
MLSSTTDVEALAKKAFMHLDGVNDDWIKAIEISRIAGGQLPADQDKRLAMELATVGPPFQVATCCSNATKHGRSNAKNIAGAAR